MVCCNKGTGSDTEVAGWNAELVLKLDKQSQRASPVLWQSMRAASIIFRRLVGNACAVSEPWQHAPSKQSGCEAKQRNNSSAYSGSEKMSSLVEQQEQPPRR